MKCNYKKLKNNITIKILLFYICNFFIIFYNKYKY